MACCGKAAYEKNEAPNRKHITHQRAAISHTWCKNAKRPCPICAQRRPRITKSSGSCSRARLGTCQNAPRGFLPSHGLPPTMAAFRRKAAQLQIQLRGKPRIPTGFLLIPPPRSAATKGMMIRRISFTMSKIPQPRAIVNCFLCILAASYNCPPNNSLQSNRVRQHFSVVKPARSEYNKK